MRLQGLRRQRTPWAIQPCPYRPGRVRLHEGAAGALARLATQRLAPATRPGVDFGGGEAQQAHPALVDQDGRLDLRVAAHPEVAADEPEQVEHRRAIPGPPLHHLARLPVHVGRRRRQVLEDGQQPQLIGDEPQQLVHVRRALGRHDPRQPSLSFEDLAHQFVIPLQQPQLPGGELAPAPLQRPLHWPGCALTLGLTLRLLQRCQILAKPLGLSDQAALPMLL